jgi:dihydroneopterin aldolase / 2-amino-4-hydroxy-6-hydroxymethyldihydropteridine diphosphokinase
MTDQIEISAIRTVAIVGALPHEREIPQPLQIDLTLDVDLGDAGRSDDLDDTVHYGWVADQVVAVVSESKDVLLERLAARVAEEVLAFDRVEAVTVTLTKLRPPLAVDAAGTAVRITRTRSTAAVAPQSSHRAFIALGSNLGDRRAFLRMGVAGLERVVAMSQVYETDPVGGPDDQGAYLNMVVEIETPLDPFALLRRCQRIEGEAMRQRVVRWGARTLDVDIIMYDDAVIETADLVVPHPHFAERRFVLTPLAEIAPQRCPDGWDERLEPAGITALGPLDLS